MKGHAVKELYLWGVKTPSNGITIFIPPFNGGWVVGVGGGQYLEERTLTRANSFH